MSNNINTEEEIFQVPAKWTVAALASWVTGLYEKTKELSAVSDNQGEIIKEQGLQMAELKIQLAAMSETVSRLSNNTGREMNKNLPAPHGFRPVILTGINNLTAVPGSTDGNGDGFEGWEEAVAHADAKGQRDGRDVIAVVPYWNFTEAEEPGEGEQKTPG